VLPDKIVPRACRHPAQDADHDLAILKAPSHHLAPLVLVAARSSGSPEAGVGLGNPLGSPPAVGTASISAYREHGNRLKPEISHQGARCSRSPRPSPKASSWLAGENLNGEGGGVAVPLRRRPRVSTSPCPQAACAAARAGEPQAAGAEVQHPGGLPSCWGAFVNRDDLCGDSSPPSLSRFVRRIGTKSGWFLCECSQFSAVPSSWLSYAAAFCVTAACPAPAGAAAGSPPTCLQCLGDLFRALAPPHNTPVAITPNTGPRSSLPATSDGDWGEPVAHTTTRRSAEHTLPAVISSATARFRA